MLNALNLDSTLRISKNKDIELIWRIVNTRSDKLPFVYYYISRKIFNFGGQKPPFLNLALRRGELNLSRLP